jgi:DNA polymerase-4
VEALWGVGPVTARRLRALGIERLVDIRTADVDRLRQAVGSHVEWLRQLAQGLDPRPVEPDRPRKSVGSENTFPRDLHDLADMRREVARLAGRVAGWLERHGRFARTVTLKVRYADFTTVTRSASGPPTHDRDEVTGRALALLERTEAGRRPVRLLGVSAHTLADRAEAPPARGEGWLPFPEPAGE